ncbi:MAG: hypothetical protein PHE61_06345, partial [Candidatus Omnitrophica bacterium]|nr:hypothetical protein [Candidatus Omnitrophota bacterium]
MNINSNNIKRILITRLDRIGDVILSTPVFEAAKKKFPGCYLACLVQPHAEEIVRGNPYIDEVILDDKKG